MDEADRLVLIERLKELGIETVKRRLATGGFPTGMERAIEDWLDEQEGKRKK